MHEQVWTTIIAAHCCVQVELVVGYDIEAIVGQQLQSRCCSSGRVADGHSLPLQVGWWPQNSCIEAHLDHEDKPIEGGADVHVV